MQSGCRGYSTSRMKAKDFNSYTVACSLIGKTMCFHVSWRFESSLLPTHMIFVLIPMFFLLLKRTPPLLVRENRESFVRKIFIIIYSIVVIILVYG